MGYRTIVVLYNDQASEWENDPLLGKKIARGMNHAAGGRAADPKADLRYGQVVECAHADCLTLGIFDSYAFKPLHHGSWRRGEADEAMKLRVLEEAAARMGYRLTKA